MIKAHYVIITLCFLFCLFLDYSQLSLTAKLEMSLSSSCAPPPPDYNLVYDPGPRNNNWAGAADLGRAQLAHSFV